MEFEAENMEVCGRAWCICAVAMMHLPILSPTSDHKACTDHVSLFSAVLQMASWASQLALAIAWEGKEMTANLLNQEVHLEPS